MPELKKYGEIIILNGTPRAGKSSIATVIQNTFEGIWMNLGVDNFMKMTPQKYQPGIGLRPGGERPDLEPLIVHMYRALYEAIGAISRTGLNVVVDVGHHEGYSAPRDILSTCARILQDLPVLFVGVHCSLEIIMDRRKQTWGVSTIDNDEIPSPVKLWQELVHLPGMYDVEVDTSAKSPEECASIIYEHLYDGQKRNVFQEIANKY